MDHKISAPVDTNQTYILKRASPSLLHHPQRGQSLSPEITWYLLPRLGRGSSSRLSFPRQMALPHMGQKRWWAGQSRCPVYQDCKSFLWSSYSSPFSGALRYFSFHLVHFHKHVSCPRGAKATWEHIWPFGSAAFHQGEEIAMTQKRIWGIGCEGEHLVACSKPD